MSSSTTELNQQLILDENQKLLTIKLAKLCQGFSLDLDKELKKLIRNDFNGEALRQANQMAEQHLLARNKQLQLSQAALKNILQQLVSLTSNNAALQERLDKLTLSIEKPMKSVWEYSIFLQQLLDIASKIHVNPNDTNSAPALNTRQFSQELLTTIDTLTLQPELQEDARQICEQLHHNLNAYDLISLYKKTINILIATFQHEKNSAKAFLGVLHQSLEAVAQALNSSITDDKSSSLLKERLNNKVNESINALTNTVEQGLDSSAIKQSIILNIERLKQDLAARNELEKQESRKLNASLSTMQNRLKHITSEAQNFRSLLLAQYKINQLDSLTQIPNRSALESKITSSHKYAITEKVDTWIIIADIDRFKNINDTFGHNAGDKCLQIVAQTLQDSLPNDAFIARYGGEEFVGILENYSPKAAFGACETVRKAIKALGFKFKDQQITITISIGAAKFRANEASEQTFERADAALYSAKRTSRDKVVIDEV